MRHNNILDLQAQPDVSTSPPYHRRRAIGHHVGCCCEACFVYLERAIEKYLPGFFPADPLELQLRQMEQENLGLRKENERLRDKIKVVVLPHQRPMRKPSEYRGVDFGS
jgi:hypothetical protein